MSNPKSISQHITEGLTHTLSAAMFLSRLPLGWLREQLAPRFEEAGFEETARYFGFAAIIVSLPAAIIVLLTEFAGLSSQLSAVLVVITMVLTTGALHEDALADVADGFGGGRSIVEKLSIMRDSRVGTYGGVALVLALLLQVVLVAQLLKQIPSIDAVLVLIAANAVSSAFIVGPWASFLPARAGGGLSTKQGIPSSNSALFSNIAGASIGLVLLWLACGLWPALVAIACCYGATAGFSLICERQVGGHTGDTLGATKKISELGLLLALIIAT